MGEGGTATAAWPAWLRPVGDAEAAPAVAALLDAARARRGVAASRLLRLLAHSPAALEAYLGLDGALAGGALDLAVRERIALAVSAANGCAPCVAHHRAVARSAAGLDAAEIARAEAGASVDPRAGAAVGLALALVRAAHPGEAGGGPTALEGAVAVARAAGLGEAQVLEVAVAAHWAALANAVQALAAAGVGDGRRP